MIKRIAQTAGFTGLLAALLLTLLQSFWVAPLILQAETFENAPVAEVAHAHAAGAAAHTHDAEAWEPENGWQRVLLWICIVTTEAGFGTPALVRFVQQILGFTVFKCLSSKYMACDVLLSACTYNAVQCVVVPANKISSVDATWQPW